MSRRVSRSRSSCSSWLMGVVGWRGATGASRASSRSSAPGGRRAGWGGVHGFARATSAGRTSSRCTTRPWPRLAGRASQLDVGTGGGSVSAGDLRVYAGGGRGRNEFDGHGAGGAVQAPEGRGEFVDVGLRTRRGHGGSDPNSMDQRPGRPSMRIGPASSAAIWELSPGTAGRREDRATRPPLEACGQQVRVRVSRLSVMICHRVVVCPRVSRLASTHRT